MTDRYAVVGNPVEHSLSPQIHAAFAAQTGADLDYGKLFAPVDGFAATVEAFFAAGGSGLNVTLPFKVEAYEWVDETDPAAEVARAVNTIVVRETGYRGCNTDGVGLVRDLVDNLGAEVSGKRVLVLGAGGATRGVLGPLLALGPAALVVANRTEAKARALAEAFGGIEAAALAAFAGPGGPPFDIVVNATSAGVGGRGDLIDRSHAEGALCYDLFYALAGPTPFCAWARASGAASVADGLGMLVEQAAEAFFLWRGERPSTAPVIGALRAGGAS